MDSYYTKKILYISLFMKFVTTKSVQPSSIKTKHGTLDVDDFLSKIIISDKFNEFAEKIADKAVEKFQKLQEIKISPSPSSLNNMIAYRVSELESVKQINSSEELDGNEKAIHKTAQSQTINLNAFLNKESNSMKKLSLKYKDFTKSTIPSNSRELDDNNVLTDIVETTPTKLSTIAFEDETSLATTAKEKSYDFDGTTKPHSLDASEEQVIVSNKKSYKLYSKGMASVNEKSNEDLNYQMTKDEHKENDQHSMSKENRVNQKLNLKHDSFEVIDSREVNSDSLNGHEKDQENSPDFVYRSSKIRKHGYEYLQSPQPVNKIETSIESKASAEPVTEENHIEIDVEQIPKTKANKKRKMRENQEVLKKSETFGIRKEGNKLYTFENNPEYDDYRHEISKIQRRLKNIE